MIRDRDELDTLAQWVDGAWACDGRTIDDGELIEPTTVLWLTAGRYFADIREFRGPVESDGPAESDGWVESDGPAESRDLVEPHDLDKTQAFSGRITVEGDVVSWYHDLDTMDRPEGHSDANPVVGTRDDLVEIGENYKEFWHRVDQASVLRGVAERMAGDRVGANQIVARVVLVGKQAIAIWSLPQPGAALFVDRGGWTLSFAIGCEYGDDLISVVVGLASGGPLTPEWSVVPYDD